MSVLVGACAGPDPESADADRGDGALSPELQRVLEIDSPLFNYIRDGVVLSSGAVVLLDQYAPALRWYDRHGEPTRSVGTRGRGPGEFMEPLWVDNCGVDSLFVWDYARRTMLVFDSTGTFGREFRPSGNPHAIECSAGAQRYVALGLPREFHPPNDEGLRAPAPISILDQSGELLVEMGDVPIGENRPLGRQTRIAVAQDRILVGTADSAWIDAFTLDGRADGGVRLPSTPPKTPTMEEYRAGTEVLVSLTSDRELRDMIRDRYLALELPEHIPPYSALTTDPLGRAWAVVSTPYADTTRIVIASIGAEPVRHVTIPEPLEIMWVGGSELLALRANTNGSQSVLLYSVSR